MSQFSSYDLAALEERLRGLINLRYRLQDALAAATAAKAASVEAAVETGLLLLNAEITQIQAALVEPRGGLEP